MTTQRAAELLTGLTLNGEWQVLQRLADEPKRRYSIFSVGYVVRNIRTGVEAFCKALDYSAAFDSDDPPEELKILTAAYVFERNLLDHCGRHGMSRIVRVLAHGKVSVSAVAYPDVNFLIFEKADGDFRTIIESKSSTDALVAVAVAHDCAVALAQLHRKGITHQDVKPANVLGWIDTDNRWRAKLADLGRAFCESMDSPHADLCCPGDLEWAPPEVLYNLQSGEPRNLRQRQLADLYSLGSLACFLFTQVPYSGILARELNHEQHWRRWQGGFEAARAFIVDAHDAATECIRSAIHPEATGVTEIISDLCQPVADRRGNLVAPRGNQPTSVLLERYITKFDLIKKRVAVARAREARAMTANPSHQLSIAP